MIASVSHETDNLAYIAAIEKNVWSATILLYKRESNL